MFVFFFRCREATTQILLDYHIWPELNTQSVSPYLSGSLASLSLCLLHPFDDSHLVVRIIFQPESSSATHSPEWINVSSFWLTNNGKRITIVRKNTRKIRTRKSSKIINARKKLKRFNERLKNEEKIKDKKDREVTPDINWPIDLKTINGLAHYLYFLTHWRINISKREQGHVWFSSEGDSRSSFLLSFILLVSQGFPVNRFWMRHRTFFINGKQGNGPGGHGDSSESLYQHQRQSSSSSSSLGSDSSGPEKNEIKCCIIGDEAVGKTAMIVSYLSNGYPEKYTPTVHDCFTGKSSGGFCHA